MDWDERTMTRQEYKRFKWLARMMRPRPKPSEIEDVDKAFASFDRLNQISRPQIEASERTERPCI